MQVENKRVKVALLVSEKTDFKLKTIIDKEGYYIIIKIKVEIKEMENQKSRSG